MSGAEGVAFWLCVAVLIVCLALVAPAFLITVLVTLGWICVVILVIFAVICVLIILSH